MFSAATRACTLGAGLATRACRPNAWQHHQWCGAQTGSHPGRRLLPRPAQRQLPPPGRASVASHAYTTGREYRDCTVGALNCVCDARRHPTDSCLAVTRRSSHLAGSCARWDQHASVHAHTHAHNDTHAHACTCTRTRTRTRIQARTRTHARMPALTHLYTHHTRAVQPAAESSTPSRFDRGLAQARHRVEHSSPVRSRTRASPTQSLALLAGSAAHVQPAAAQGHYCQLSCKGSSDCASEEQNRLQVICVY